MARSFAPPAPLAEFREDDIDALISVGTEIRFGKGSWIFRQGEAGKGMFIVLEGRVQLLFGAEKPPKALGPGDYFGELALLRSPHNRTASAVAIEPTTLVNFGIDALEGLSRTRPRLLVTFLRSACTYLLASEQELVEDLRRKNRELEDTLDYLRRTFDELSHQELLAQTDELTGLYNRRCLAMQIDKFVMRAEAKREPLAVLALDLDGLKPINDTHGHGTGDEVLRQVGRIIKSQVRKSDLPCRTGGDEFCVLLTDITPELARNRADEIRRAIFRISGDIDGLPTVTVSIGGTMHQEGLPARELLEQADQLLYQAKTAGKNKLCWMGEVLEPQREVV